MGWVSMRNSVGIAALCMSLVGCVQGPQFEASHRGAIPSSGSYMMVEGDNRPDAPWTALLAARLDRLNLTADAQPRYVVQVGRAERGRRVGVVVGVPDPDAPRRRYPRGRVISTVELNISDAQSGTELYRATAIRAARTEARPETWAELLDLALAPPEAP